MVGNVDAGLSQARWPGWRTQEQPQQPQQQQQQQVVEVTLSGMFLEALPLALLGFMESYSVGRKMAEVRRRGRREGGREGGIDVPEVLLQRFEHLQNIRLLVYNSLTVSPPLPPLSDLALPLGCPSRSMGNGVRKYGRVLFLYFCRCW